MEAYVDRSALLKDVPRKCWVALNENENTVIGHGDTIEAALAWPKDQTGAQAAVAEGN